MKRTRLSRPSKGTLRRGPNGRNVSRTDPTRLGKSVKSKDEEQAGDRILIITLANSVHEEDGIGQRVAHKLRKLAPPSNVEILDQYTDLLGLGYRIRDARRVIVVDVFLGQDNNGGVHVIPCQELSSYRGCTLSARQLSSVESLELLLTVDPSLARVEIYLILVEICTIKAAPELPLRFESSIQQVTKAIQKLISEPFNELEPAPDLKRGRSLSQPRTAP